MIPKQIRTLALVTAKASSTRLAYKNKAILHGKPLYKWTVEFVESWRGHFFTDAIFSSDKPFGFRLYGGWVIVRRPKILIEDKTPHILSVKHGLEFAEAATGRRYDAVFLFQPTNPIRSQMMLAHATTLLAQYGLTEAPYFSRCAYKDENLDKKYIINANFHYDECIGPPLIKSGAVYVYNRAYLLDGDCTQTKPVERVMMVDKMHGYNINDGLDMRITETFMRELGVTYGYEGFYAGTTC